MERGISEREKERTKADGHKRQNMPKQLTESGKHSQRDIAKQRERGGRNKKYLSSMEMKFQALLKEFVFWISITRKQINRIHCINSFVTMPTRQLTVDTTKIDGICTTFIYFAFFLF